MRIYFAIALALMTVLVADKHPPAGEYLYVQPEPAIIAFDKDEIRFIPVKFLDDSRSRGIEIKPGVVIPYGSAETLDHNKKALNVLADIKLKDGDLFFDDVRMDFGGLRIYKIREAYRWGEWIVCDGYSSASDDILKVPSERREGLLPSEVIYFRPDKRIGKTKPFGTAPLSIEIIGDGSFAAREKTRVSSPPTGCGGNGC